jgi:hypothetical protein
MGWLFHDVPPARYHDVSAEIDRIFTPSNPEDKYEILQKSRVGSTWYVACRINDKETIAFVILTKSYMERGVRWWGYKDMDETMGPYHCKAPKSLIAKLDPPKNENSAKWREACLNRPKTPPRFRLPEPVTFSNGWKAQSFEKAKGRSVYRALDIPNQPLVRLHRTDFSKAEAI